MPSSRSAHGRMPTLPPPPPTFPPTDTSGRFGVILSLASQPKRTDKSSRSLKSQLKRRPESREPGSRETGAGADAGDVRGSKWWSRCRLRSQAGNMAFPALLSSLLLLLLLLLLFLFPPPLLDPIPARARRTTQSEAAGPPASRALFTVPRGLLFLFFLSLCLALSPPLCLPQLHRRHGGSRCVR